MLEEGASALPAEDNRRIDSFVIDSYRERVKFYLNANSAETALFWADKIVSISSGDPRDVYWLAQCMYRSEQYHRAAALIRKRGLDRTEPLCQWLAGLALFDAKEYSDALHMLFSEEERSGIASTHPSTIGPSTASPVTLPPIENDAILEGFSKKQLQSAILLLKGRIYEKLDNRSRAADYFTYSLHHDVHCYEAYQALIKYQMLTAAEEKELLSFLPFKEHCFDPDLLPMVYEVLLNKYQSSPLLSSPASLPHPQLEDNLDMKVARAEKLYYACAYRQCFDLTEEVLNQDQYHTSCLPIHISCLVELKKVNKLFYLAHELIDLMPEKAVSWFAVGCYYSLTGNRDPARRYLGKATSLDKLFAPAWLAYGHSFAAENEHDQAMAAYFSATKFMTGCHLPLLYIGLECGLTNNIRLAEKFFTQALTIAPHDPFVIHEMGVIAFQNQDYNMAEKHFLTALSHVHEINQSIIAEKWEALLNNLGHTCRKLKKYDDALRYHQQALVLSPQNPSTLTCMAYVHLLQKNLMDAADMFHKSLSLRRDDTFSTSMLNFTMEYLCESTEPYQDSVQTSWMPTDIDKPKSPPLGLNSEDSLTSSLAVETFSPLPSPPSCEVDMQDSFRDENTT